MILRRRKKSRFCSWSKSTPSWIYFARGRRGSVRCEWKTRGRCVTLSQAGKISILWLIQIDAILDLSERLWVPVQEPSRASFSEDGPIVKKSALQRKFHQQWGKLNLFFEGYAIFFLKNVRLKHRGLIRDMFTVPREYRKPNCRAPTCRKCYGQPSCFGLPKSAMENSVGIVLKDCTLAHSGFKLKENELSQNRRQSCFV